MLWQGAKFKGGGMRGTRDISRLHLAVWRPYELPPGRYMDNHILFAIFVDLSEVVISYVYFSFS